jgi:hypothetical protein
MNESKITRSIIAVTIMLPTLLAATGVVAKPPEYTSSFMLKECKGFSATGRNPFFILEPGYKLNYEGRENGKKLHLNITVLNSIKVVDGIKTRVVKETSTENGKVVEISRNYFAICNRNNSVVYFGEDVDNYENGVVINNDGSWLAGVKGAKAGIFMPGIVLLGARYFQEIAPRVALDRAEIISLDDVIKTPAGIFKNSLRTDETTPLDPGVVESKWYAPGIGLIQDGPLKLVKKPPR